ncbi:LacI family DNA-binding transcriptional regulator [Pseudomonas rhizoryzae]|uniref:LacI family DNA-binding transcriptional regulator n=1 Tax=Pseudomonas rhizoryzae TaxID=2571129 RepID=UPI000736306C|nr:LacI family DNA-binding transcriptional regulator [Pseudomonas rhizoryzae]KTT34627.1 GntR family transcriptional regulator [Pseudomonas psychrotolerans]KTT75077.1 GntR family transcriptional regulator [Pseudomonas psychrotolerans]
MARKSRRELAQQSGSSELPLTVREVALAAGVSPITVSRALHRPTLVSEATREHVLAVVKELGYVPNLLAGSLASSKSKLVAILLPTIANSIYATVVQTLMEHLTEAGYQALIGPTGYSPEKEEELLEAILGRRPDGIVLTGTLHTPASRERLAALNIPVVEAWDLSEEALDMQVGFSHEQVGIALADHFVARGYRRFGVISVDDPRALRRNLALQARLAELGITELPREILPLPATWEVGRIGLSRLLERPEPPELVLCSSDTLALGVCAEASSRGLRIPEQLGVVGFGDTTNGRFATPALSTVSVNADAMGRRVAQSLLNRLAGERTAVRFDTGFELLERQSS